MFIFCTLFQIYFYFMHYINSILVKFFILFCFSPNIVALIIYISSLLTELTSVSFLMISLALMFLSIKNNKNFYYLLFSLFLFLTYQIRPSFVVFVFIPIIFCFYVYNFQTKNFFKKILFFSMFPLISFIVLRFL